MYQGSMKISKRVTVLFGMFLFYLVLGICGVILQYWYPDIAGTDSRLTLVFLGCSVLFGGMVAYHLYRNHRDPAWIKIMDKPYQDERWMRVQEKGASVALCAVLFLLILCSVYAEYLCRILLGITDAVAVHAIHELFLYLAFISLGILLLSIVYYYYARV